MHGHVQSKTFLGYVSMLKDPSVKRTSIAVCCFQIYTCTFAFKARFTQDQPLLHVMQSSAFVSKNQNSRSGQALQWSMESVCNTANALKCTLAKTSLTTKSFQLFMCQMYGS